MPVDALAPSLTLMPPRLRQVDSRVTIHPSVLKSFANLGLTLPEAFLAIPGEIVSGHPDRHVMRVVLDDGRAAYLKREHRIRWKDRLRNWRADFGWTSKSVREGRILQDLEERKLPGPQWLAFGEDGQGRAFVLLEEVAASIDLRRAWPDVADPIALAMQLGRFCAELHQSNVDHPDLCAKHFLIDPATNAITLLDWQRATIGQPVEWPRRIRAVAALLATLPDSENHWDVHFLWSYLRAVRGQGLRGVPKFSALTHRVHLATGRLLCRRGIREQRQPPLDRCAQRLVWIDGEALCAIPEVAANLSQAVIREMLYDPARNQQPILLAEGRPAHLEVGVHRALLSRVISWLRRKSWRSPELRKARLLFHLERHHVPAAKLLAYGQRCQELQAKAFLLTGTVESSPLSRALAAADEDTRHLLLDRLAKVIDHLHEAGCAAETIECFGVRQEGSLLAIVVADVARLRFRKHLSARRKRIDARQVARSMKNYCGPQETQHFLDLLAESR